MKKWHLFNKKNKKEKVKIIERKQNEKFPNWTTAMYRVGDDDKLITWRPKMDKVKLTEEISKHLGTWCRLNDILWYLALPQSTYYEWLKNDEEFRNEVNKAKAKFQIDCYTTFHARLMNPNNKDITMYLMKTAKPEEETPQVASLNMMKNVAKERIEERDQMSALEQKKQEFEDEKNKFEEEKKILEEERNKFEEEKKKLEDQNRILGEKYLSLEEERKELYKEKKERGVEKKKIEKKNRIMEEEKRTIEDRERCWKEEMEEIEKKRRLINSVTMNPNEKASSRLSGGGKQMIEKLNVETKKSSSNREIINMMDEILEEFKKYWLITE